MLSRFGFDIPPLVIRVLIIQQRIPAGVFRQQAFEPHQRIIPKLSLTFTREDKDSK